MATHSEAKVTLKLLIDTKSQKVLFAEAEKDFVDFLFNLLHLPVGTVVRLLTEQSQQTMVGALGKLYESIQNLSETYFLPNQTKDSVLKPKAPLSATQVPLLSLDGGTSFAKRYYSCSYSSSHRYIADNAHAVCPHCNVQMNREYQYVAAANEVAAAGEGGFVKGMVTYMVMDDLVVTPISTISSITMLNKFNVKDVGALEERVVDFGMPEGLKLWKASLHTEKVLTSVFLGNKGD
ncbi:hypothetical protein RHGRI_027503 [Rhododendron griersonianum]|uniref:DUF674 domain-containing protein n=1 Tax=Rhododendron griersonianum TaxID=479676 RepID=A0AAV6IYG8_9ERIC|nr:hypothetical protein RHGRI_027503 [Rhododendron griersonianum]